LLPHYASEKIPHAINRYTGEIGCSA
jgi:hypothetical protein